MDSSSSPYNRGFAGSLREEESDYKFYASRISCKRCCCCVLTVLLLILLIATVIALLVIFVLKPMKPQFGLKSVQLESLRIEPPISTDKAAYLTMNITMIFSATNPNKVGIKYRAAEFLLLYKGIPMGLASIPAFYQPSHANTTLRAEIVVSRVNLVQNSAAELMRDATVNQRLNMRITGDVSAAITFLRIDSPPVKVAVDCEITARPRGQAIRDKTTGAYQMNVFSSPASFKPMCSILVYV